MANFKDILFKDNLCSCRVLVQIPPSLVITVSSLFAPLKQKLIDSRIFLQKLEISNAEIKIALFLEFNLFVSMTVWLL